MASAEKRGKGPRPWRARYKKPDGSWGSEPGFATKSAALAWGRRQEAAIEEGRWTDPQAGAITLDQWWAEWLPAQEYAPGSQVTMRSLYRTHLQPWRGGQPIRDIGLLDVNAFEAALRKKLGWSMVRNVMSLLKVLMEDAVLDGRLHSSPVITRRRRGKKGGAAPAKPPRKGVAITFQMVLAIAARIPDAGVGGPAGMIMVLVTAFTGLRWGEVSGMQRKFLALFPAEDGQPASGWYIVDDKEGALHYRTSKDAHLGPPKGYTGRTVELPPFLVEILLAYMASLPAGQQMLFLTATGRMLRHDCAVYWAWRRACDGWTGSKYSRTGGGRVDAAPLHTGLHFHDLRHTHKTWLVEDDVPVVARDERLGHHGRTLAVGERGAQDHVYVHATAVMRARLLAGLQRRWESAPAETAHIWELISHFFPTEAPSPSVDHTPGR